MIMKIMKRIIWKSIIKIMLIKKQKLIRESIIKLEQVKIKFEMFNDDQERERSKTSAQMIFELCHDVKDRLMLPLSKLPIVVAPLEVLEVLKASHIYWSAGF